MPVALKPSVSDPWPAVATVQYAPAPASTSQLLITLWPRKRAPVAVRYCPLPLSLCASCSDAELETTPPQTVPVPGSRAPANDSRLSLTLSRTTMSRTGPSMGPRRRPAVQVSVRNPCGEIPAVAPTALDDSWMSPPCPDAVCSANTAPDGNVPNRDVDRPSGVPLESETVRALAVTLTVFSIVAVPPRTPSTVDKRLIPGSPFLIVTGAPTFTSGVLRCCTRSISSCSCCASLPDSWLSD